MAEGLGKYGGPCTAEIFRFRIRNRIFIWKKLDSILADRSSALFYSLPLPLPLLLSLPLLSNHDDHATLNNERH